ncbi:putative carboxypeptidase [Ochromonadaceae sp. CCMP2298]|nr:putative carboxypeptidase [Ochromonadaceae sp. CCMP2298]
MSTVYDDTAKRLREIAHLEGISGLLGWDEMVLLPPGSSGCRGDQKAALAGVIYDKKTDATLGANLQQLHNAGAALTQVQNAVVRDSYKEYTRTTAIPKELAQRIALLETSAYEKWIVSRKAADFSIFAPSLQEWVDVNQQRANLIDPSSPPYDVMLDMYEKGMKAERIDEIFSQVRAGLVPLISQLKTGTPPDSAWLAGDYDVDVQAKMVRQISIDLGFDIDKGRLDVSVHPFTGGSHPTDVRMTTRFKANDLTEGLTGAIHETGHAMYEQGRNLDPEWKNLPVSLAMSMGVHESQSLLWERLVALNRPFQHYLLPKIREFFPTFPTEATPESLYLAQNTMRDPSLIRVEADELTYTLHVILRYEIERGLVDGSIKVTDVPAVWNAKMLDYLGVTPPDDAQGCLQDIHWAGGAMGYFPTYTLGAMMAVPGLEESLSKGEFAPLRLWLNEHLHRRGSLDASADDLMLAVTGKALDPQVYLRYLGEKYREIYQV